MKLMIVGHAQHGKDTVCGLLRDMYGLTFVSSSWFVGEKAVRPYLEKHGLIYPTMEACYADRHSSNEMRALWYNAICEYNAQDAGRLGKELFAQYDIYCGLRNIKEFEALRKAKAFDVAFWVDRYKYVTPEPITSMTIDCLDADYIIDNNNDLDDLRMNIIEAMDWAMDCGSIEKKSPNLISQ